MEWKFRIGKHRNIQVGAIFISEASLQVADTMAFVKKLLDLSGPWTLTGPKTNAAEANAHPESRPCSANHLG